MQPYYPLNFGQLDLIRPSYTFQSPRAHVINGQIAYDNQVDVVPSDILTEEFRKILWELDLPIRRVIVFAYSNRVQNTNVHPHIDGHGDFNMAINMTFGTSIHHIEWYTPKTPDAGITRHTDFGEEVKIFEPDDLDLFMWTSRKKPMLFNAAIPHKAVMRSGTEEWTVSIRLNLKADQQDMLLARLDNYMEKG
jgi:hypothetical protein